LVARNTHQDLDSIPDPDLGIWNVAGDVMSLYDKLVKIKDELGRKSIKDPRTADELLVRKNYERVMNILWKRYEYGIDDMEEYRWGDFRDDIAAVKRF
jgi:hypothetical protein